MIGNSLNTLDIKSANIDNRFAASATVWYDHNDFGKPWNDYEHHDVAGGARRDGVHLRARGSPVRSRRGRPGEQRDVHLGRPVPVRDGRAGAERHDLARGLLPVGDRRRDQVPGPRVQRRVLSALAESLHAPTCRLPIDSMFDWGFDASLGYFVRKSVELYVRSSLIDGPFATAVEGAVGVNWYPFDTRQVWLSAEAVGIKNCPLRRRLLHVLGGPDRLRGSCPVLLRF